VDGRFMPGLSKTAALPPGLVAGSLAERLAAATDGLQGLLEAGVAAETNGFRSLNTALFEDGAYVEIPRGVVCEAPIHILYIATGAPGSMSTIKNVVLAGENSQVSIVEHYVSVRARHAEPDFVNTQTLLRAAENAVVKHFTVQRLPEQAFFVANVRVDQDRFSNVTSRSIALGAGWARTDAAFLLDAEGAECTVDGLYMATRNQHVDFHTTITHAKPHCTSHELFKGIVGGHATAVFNGRVVVPPDAQKTDSDQSNHNLLLSDNATVNTKPQLEIYANDVKCAHGTTVGQLDEESVFYLRARGIGTKEAKALLTQAFAREILERIPVEGLREKLDQLVLDWFPASELEIV
jgi:Fe-S cluster assembly protein SufD